MSDWAVALIAAGSAVAGSAVTGWFTRNTGIKQAEAARHAGEAQAAAARHAGEQQANALLDTVRASLEEQRIAREHGIRRQVYGEFLGVTERAQRGLGEAHEMRQALGALAIEGPAPVLAAAQAWALSATQFAGAGDQTAEGQEMSRRREHFLYEARQALSGPLRAPADPA